MGDVDISCQMLSYKWLNCSSLQSITCIFHLLHEIYGWDESVSMCDGVVYLFEHVVYDLLIWRLLRSIACCMPKHALSMS